MFTFTREDAERAGLLRKNTWKQYPKAMYHWQAVSEACRIVCPDVIAGMDTHEDLTEDAEIDPETGGLADAEEVASEVVPADFKVQ